MNVVEVKRLRKEYGSLVAVHDVDLTIEKGQVLGLIGPNGAGKTTLLKMLATLLVPTAGEITIAGHDPRVEQEQVRRKIGYMPDFFNLYDGLTLDDCVRFFGRAYGVDEAQLDARVGDALEQVGLTEKRHDAISHLSRGMTQRLGVANLLVHEPEIILLDEPASGLDPAARIQLRKVLHKLAAQGHTIVISSHILTELEDLCTHICAMQRGKIMAQGNIEDIRAKLSSSQVKVTIWDAAGNPAAFEHAVQVTRSFASVSAVEVASPHLLVSISDTGRAVAELNRTLVENGFLVSAIQEERKGLEALFIEITAGAPLSSPPGRAAPANDGSDA